ncbi:hypothetical protein CCYA_CCYA13G3465 [Cyanidiococcus yangmingshanensis]|nr:hypothetical protein CCYA_CCYA13G3465 [Cyanidiococcus yangmingshanensis]
MAFVISSSFLAQRRGSLGIQRSRCVVGVGAKVRRVLVAQLQAEPQPGEPGYRPPMTKTAPTSELVKKGVVKSPFSDATERGPGEEEEEEDIPEAAKRPIRAPMAAVGRPKVVPKRAKTKEDEDEERLKTAQARSFAEARGGSVQQQQPQQPAATAAPTPAAQARPSASPSRRAVVDTAAVPKFPGLPAYLQPLPEDTREQREKLRARIPTSRK